MYEGKDAKHFMIHDNVHEVLKKWTADKEEELKSEVVDTFARKVKNIDPLTWKYGIKKLWNQESSEPIIRFTRIS